MNLPTAIVLVALAVVVACVVRKMVRDRKMGKGCCGCSGGCAGCHGMASGGEQSEEEDRRG